MNITKESTSDLSAVINIKVEKSDYEKTYEGKIRDYAQKANIPGFRKGKVPAGIIKKMYGEGLKVEEVSEFAYNQLMKYIDEEKLQILGEPILEDSNKDIDWNADDIDIRYEIGWAPEIKVTVEEKSKATKYNITIDDKLIDEQVEDQCKRFGIPEDVDVVGDNSIVYGKIEELEEGKVKPEGIVNDSAMFMVSTIKNKKYQKTFIGKKKDEVVVFHPSKIWGNDTAEIRYILGVDEEMTNNLESDFQITITNAKNTPPHPINEDLFKKVFGEHTEVKTEGDFRKKISEELEMMFSRETGYKYFQDVKEELLKATKLDLPTEFLKKWLLQRQEKTEGETPEDAQKKIDETWKDSESEFRWQLVKREIVKQYNVEVNQEELKEFAVANVRQQFAQFGLGDVPDEHLLEYAEKMFTDKNQLQQLHQSVSEEKLIAAINEKTNPKTKDVSLDEFKNLVEKDAKK